MGPARHATSPLLTSYFLGISLGLEMSLMLNELKRIERASLGRVFKESDPSGCDLMQANHPRDMQVSFRLRLTCLPTQECMTPVPKTL